MTIRIKRVEVWSAEVEDGAGGLKKALDGIAGAKGSLDCIIARRQPEKPGTAVVFVAPITGTAIQAAAYKSGYHESRTVPSLRIEGDDRPGLGRDLAAAIAEAGVSMRGLSSMTLGPKFVGYVGFNSPEDLMKAETALKNFS